VATGIPTLNTGSSLIYRTHIKQCLYLKKAALNDVYGPFTDAAQANTLLFLEFSVSYH
jgi:hypothetical protein